MKKIRYIIETVLAILMIAVLIFCIKNDIAPQNVFNENVLKPEGTWSEKMLISDEIVQYEYDIPKSQNEKNWIMMLKTHWVGLILKSLPMMSVFIAQKESEQVLYTYSRFQQERN